MAEGRTYLPRGCGTQCGGDRFQHLHLDTWVHVDHFAIAAAVSAPEQRSIGSVFAPYYHTTAIRLQHDF